MGIRKYKPTSAGRRDASVSDFKELTKGAKPEKSLLRPMVKISGRNNQGMITARHRGGGHKRRYRVIDFKRDKDGVEARRGFDPVRPQPQCPHCVAALRRRRKALHSCSGRSGKGPYGIESGPDAPPTVGNCLPLKNIPLASAIHNIEMRPGQGGCPLPKCGNRRSADGPRSQMGTDFIAQW